MPVCPDCEAQFLHFLIDISLGDDGDSSLCVHPNRLPWDTRCTRQRCGILSSIQNQFTWLCSSTKNSNGPFWECRICTCDQTNTNLFAVTSTMRRKETRSVQNFQSCCCGEAKWNALFCSVANSFSRTFSVLTCKQRSRSMERSIDLIDQSGAVPEGTFQYLFYSIAETEKKQTTFCDSFSAHKAPTHL